MARGRGNYSGSHYKVCPCAKLTSHGKGGGWTQYEAWCYSPKRPGTNGGTQAIKLPTNSEEAGRCGGRVLKGVGRYTQCPYYSRGFKAPAGSGVYTGPDKGGDLLFKGGGAVLFLLIAWSCIRSGMEHSGIAGLVFLILAALCVVSIFRKK